MDLLALPKQYYATETKPIHLVGYTLALGMMVVGLAETVHSIPYMIRGESDTVGKILGPAVLSQVASWLHYTLKKPESIIDESPNYRSHHSVP